MSTELLATLLLILISHSDMNNTGWAKKVSPKQFAFMMLKHFICKKKTLTFYM